MGTKELIWRSLLASFMLLTLATSVLLASTIFDGYGGREVVDVQDTKTMTLSPLDEPTTTLPVPPLNSTTTSTTSAPHETPAPTTVTTAPAQEDEPSCPQMFRSRPTEDSSTTTTWPMNTTSTTAPPWPTSTTAPPSTTTTVPTADC